jgi:cytosine/adenosine deaminase-related metal-dependent hydrolase
MKRFSAQYVLTNSGQPLKRAVITTGDDGTIIYVEDTGGDLKESRGVEYFNGIIIPGFVNCHAHLELSHLKGAISEGTGLPGFLECIRTLRDYNPEEIISSALSADSFMYNEGIVLCADICNTSDTFSLKKNSFIRYINLPEVFGIDPEKAGKRLDEIDKVSAAAEESGLIFYIVPHSAYSVSLPLFRLLKEKTKKNRVTSIHFMESEAEKQFFTEGTNPLFRSYEESGLFHGGLLIPKDHADAVLNEMTLSGNLVLVHNTYAEKETVKRINSRGNTFWCLCPGSNLYIENKIPPLEMLISEGCEIVTGTDSLASNHELSILSELKILQKHFASVKFEDLIRWATVNGAKALGEEHNYGKIGAGKKPGLLLLENLDLINFRLLPETTVKRLI